MDRGHDGGADLGSYLAGLVFASHQLDHGRCGTDEDEAGRFAGLGEGRALGQETVAGMDSTGALQVGGPQYGLDRQVGLGGGRRADPHGAIGGGHVGRLPVRVGVHGHGAKPEPARRAKDPQRDLTPVGDEQRVEGHRPGYIRNTP